MQIIGIMVDGEEIVLVDSAKGEHRVSSPQDLWDAALRISGDERLPAVIVTSRPRSELDREELDDALDRLGSLVERAAGSAYGVAAGRLAKDHVPRAARGVIDLLQRVSRKGTRPLPRKEPAT